MSRHHDESEGQAVQAREDALFARRAGKDGARLHRERNAGLAQAVERALVGFGLDDDAEMAQRVVIRADQHRLVRRLGFRQLGDQVMAEEVEIDAEFTLDLAEAAAEEALLD